jgi:hypothetical protein
MAALETRIYSHPPIPLANISLLEMLILTNVLECNETDEGLVLFTDVKPANPIRVARSELAAAFGASAKNAGDPVNVFIADRVLALQPAGGYPVEDDVMVDIDLSHFPWQFVVQGIVARSPDLHEVAVIQWTNHPSQRPESFGATVSLITAKAIYHATSEDLLGRFRLQDKALLVATSAVPFCRDNGAPAGSAASDLFTAKEIETALCLWEAMLYFRGLHQDERLVPDTVARMSELWDASDGRRCGPMSAISCPSHSPSMTTSARSLRKKVSPSISISRRHLSRPYAGPRTGRPARANRKSSVKM